MNDKHILERRRRERGEVTPDGNVGAGTSAAPPPVGAGTSEPQGNVGAGSSAPEPPPPEGNVGVGTTH